MSVSAFLQPCFLREAGYFKAFYFKNSKKLGKYVESRGGYGGNSGEAKRRSEQPGVRAARTAQARA